MKLRFVTLLLLLAVFPGYFFALNLKTIKFDQISTKNGLSQNTVRTILVDKKGFVWAGTLDGLNRYDGYHIITFNPELGNPNSLNDQRIKNIFQDRKGFLWIKTYKNEFSCYDPESESFIKDLGASRNSIYSKNYYEAKNGDIWLWGEKNECHRIQHSSNSFSYHLFPTKIRDEIDKNNFLLEDSRGQIWIGSNSGLFKITQNKIEKIPLGNFGFTSAVEINRKIYLTTLQSYLFVCDLTGKKIVNSKIPTSGIRKATMLKDGNILLIDKNRLLCYNTHTNKTFTPEWEKDPELIGEIDYFKDSKNGIWIFNHTGKVWFYNMQTGIVKKLELIPSQAIHLIDLERYNVLVDKQGLYWITTYGNGLFCYNAKSGELTNFKYSPNETELTSDYLLSITEDRFGNLWIGSEFGGIIKVKSPNYNVINICPESTDSYGRNNNIRSLFRSSENEIWVGSKSGTLAIYKPDFTSPKTIARDLNPYTINEDNNGKIWVGTKGNGLYIFDAKSKAELTHLSPETNTLKQNSIFTILRDNKNRMWLGLFSGGIALVKPQNSGYKFQYFFEADGNRSYIRHLYQDRQGTIWAGTSGGLIKFNPDQLIKNHNAYKLYTMNLSDKYSINCNDIKTIYQNELGQIWIGTAGGGLNLYVPATKDTPEHFQAFTTKQGLSGNVVSAIMEDKQNNLWISTESGMNRFNKKTHSIVNYFFSDKIFGNQYNENTSLILPNGNMAWGSLEGIFEFNPKTFIPDTNTPPVTLTNFVVNGQSLKTSDAESSLTKAISYSSKIKLKYDQNSFTIEFSTLSLRDPELNTYSYILENYDSRWSPVEKSNSATYKNLNPGKYIFKVKGKNSDGIWNEQYTELTIIITPPFWRSWIAYLFYILMAVAAIYFALRLIWKFNKLNYDIKLEKKLTNHKLRFFTNISHEFRTPLTLIRGAVENLSEQKNIPESAQKQLNVLKRNSNNLSRLIDQLLEFRKLQNQVTTLDLQEVDIVQFCKDIFSGFQEMATQKKMKYSFSSNLSEYFMYIDCRKVDKIFYNLLSNAFKFTPKSGEILFSLQIAESEKLVHATVQDNGAGIPKDKQPMLFSRFMQINFSSEGTGIGLSLAKEFVDAHKGKIWYESAPENGSIFHVNLTSDTSVYKDANFIQPQKSNEKVPSLTSDILIDSIETDDVQMAKLKIRRFQISKC